jgi:hypothetical protein
VADTVSAIIVALATLAGIAILAMTALGGWREWIALKRAELDRAQGSNAAGSRIEIADLRERIRKLEAIAAGVDL